MDSESIACGYVREADSLTPQSAQVEMIEFGVSVSVLIELMHKIRVIGSLEWESGGGGMKLEV